MALLKYLIVLCVVFYVEAKFLHLDYQYDEDAKIWLKLHKVKATWHEARKMCNMEGAILASPLNKPISDALRTYSNAYNIHRLYTGIHSTFSNQIWHSVEGVPLENLADYMDISQFDSFKSTRCSVLEDGVLYSIGCEQIFNYICYKNNNASVELTSCGTLDKAYKLDKRTGHCYKFHAEARTWVDAYETCFAEQAYLAIINSETEAHLLRDMFEKHPSDTLNADHPNVLNIGMVDWEHNREWYTIHGQRIEEAGYASWSRGEPNNADVNEYCGGIFRNGLLNDEPCTKRNVFVCEKDVEYVPEESTTSTTSYEIPSTTEETQTLADVKEITESSDYESTLGSEINTDATSSESTSTTETYDMVFEISDTATSDDEYSMTTTSKDLYIKNNVFTGNEETTEVEPTRITFDFPLDAYERALFADIINKYNETQTINTVE